MPKGSYSLILLYLIYNKSVKLIGMTLCLSGSKLYNLPMQVYIIILVTNQVRNVITIYFKCLIVSGIFFQNFLMCLLYITIHTYVIHNYIHTYIYSIVNSTNLLYILHR